MCLRFTLADAAKAGLIMLPAATRQKLCTAIVREVKKRCGCGFQGLEGDQAAYFSVVIKGETWHVTYAYFGKNIVYVYFIDK